MLVEKRVLDISDITDKIVLNKVFYSGREEKYGVFFNNEQYLLKVSNTQESMNKIYCEYIVSKLYQKLGLPYVDCDLVLVNNKKCYLSKDFCYNNNYTYFSLASLFESYLDKEIETFEVSYELFCKILSENKKVDFENTLIIYWSSVIIDYCFCIRRNLSNFGFLFTPEVIKVAPIFDNAISCDISCDLVKDVHYIKNQILFKHEYKSQFELIINYKDSYKSKALNNIANNLANYLYQSISINNSIIARIIEIANYRFNMLVNRI